MVGFAGRFGQGAHPDGGQAAADGVGTEGSRGGPRVPGDCGPRWNRRVVEGQHSERAASGAGEFGRFDHVRYGEAHRDEADGVAGLPHGARDFLDLCGAGGGHDGNAGGCGQDEGDEPTDRFARKVSDSLKRLC